MKVLSKLFNGIKEFKNKPKCSQLYAVTDGKYLGEFFVYMDKTDKEFVFLSLPDIKVRNVLFEHWYGGIDKNIIDKAGKLTPDVYNVCKAQYISTTTGINT